MKKFSHLYLKSLVITNIVFILLSIIIYRRAEITLPFIRIELGALLLSLIIACSIFVFKLEKGNTLINVISGYLILIPGIFLVRFLFGTALFRFTWLFYLLFIFVGIIYSISVYVVSRKYKHLADELNSLLVKQNQDKE